MLLRRLSLRFINVTGLKSFGEEWILEALWLSEGFLRAGKWTAVRRTEQLCDLETYIWAWGPLQCKTNVSVTIELISVFILLAFLFSFII